MTDKTKEELAERVEQLEQAVNQNSETISKMLPSRRNVLKAGGLLAGGALLGSSSASGATGSAGQIGTSTDRPDIYGDSVDSNSVNTDAIGVSRDWSDETANRSFGTWYQNTTGTDILIKVESQSNASGTDIQPILDVSASETANPVTAPRVPSANDFYILEISGLVPKGYYYRVVQNRNTADVSLNRWTELY